MAATVLKLTASEKDFVEALTKASGALGKFTATANTQLARMNQTSDRITTQMNRGFSRLSNGLEAFSLKMSVMVALPLAMAAKSASDAYAEFDSLKRGMSALDPSIEGVNTRVKELEKLARLPALGFQEALKADIRMRSVGFTIEEATRIMKEFSNVVAIGGGGQQQLGEVTYQLTQMASASKVLAADLRPIISNAPMVGVALKSMFGTTSSDKISDQLEAQGKTPMEFIRMLLTEMEKGTRATGGYRTAMENLSDSLFRLKARTMETYDRLYGLTDLLGSLEGKLNGVYEGFDSLPDPMKKVIANLILLSGALPIVSFAFAKLIDMFVFMSRTLMTKTGIIGIAITVLASLGMAFYSSSVAASEFEKSIRGVAEITKEAKGATAVEVKVLRDLVEAYKGAKRGSDEAKAAKEAIIAISPTFSKFLVQDKENFVGLKTAVDNYTLSLVELEKQKTLTFQIDANKKKIAEIGVAIPKRDFSGLPILDRSISNIKAVFNPFKSVGDDQLATLYDQQEKLISANKKFEEELTKSIKKTGSAVATATAGETAKEKEAKRLIAEEKAKAADKEAKRADKEAIAEAKRRLKNHKEAIEAFAKQRSEIAAMRTFRAEESKDKANEDYREAMAKLDEQELDAIKTHNEKIKDFAEARIRNAEEARIKALDAKKRAVAEEAEALAEQQELINNAISGIASGALSQMFNADSNGLNNALRTSLNQIGDYAVKLGIAGLKIAKLKIAMFADPSGGTAVALLVAGITMKAAASSIRVNRMARGGVTDGNPIFSILGDNPSGKEMALPFERTGEFAKAIASNMKGSQGGDLSISGVNLRGRDIQLVLNRLNSYA